ncbi:MAG TPA: CBS domain-containing protein [Candidatus Methanoperedenaceae archaeon]|nr:CBS domain-containing protein [Candidatus Methanoperedenaceae archaeon]
MDHAKVRDYMTQYVSTLSPDDTVRSAIELIRRTGHDGFPVVKDGIVQGYISSPNMLAASLDEKVSKLMATDILAADENMDMDELARVMFRSGMSKLPVVDRNGKLTGIITNSDVIRSHIERTSPQKVWTLKKALETLHNIDVTIARESVNINELVPTQGKIYADELEGRIYELKKGLAEPIVVIKTPQKLLLVDGHHRVVAAQKLGITMVDAYIIMFAEDVHLGLEKTAKEAGLNSINDIRILDYARHPLVEITKRLKRDDEKGMSDVGATH